METPQNKIYTKENLLTQVKNWKSAGQKVVFTNGCFDLLHLGHLSLLMHCKSEGDKLIVAMNSDSSTRRLKGEDRPINDENLRSIMLASIYYVDAVVIFDENTPLELIKEIKPDLLVKGGDYTPDQVVGASEVTANGGEVEIFNLVEGSSTSNTIDRIKS